MRSPHLRMFGFVIALCLAKHTTADSLEVEKLERTTRPFEDEDSQRGRPTPAIASAVRFEALAGVVRWKWNEVVQRHPQLEELGFVPMASVRGIWQLGPCGVGASLELLSGAIAYDGYLQSKNGFSLVPYESNTHYLAATPEIFLQMNSIGSVDWLRPSLSLSRPWWRRTLDATKDRVPGVHGYVETWSVLAAGIGVEVARPLGKGSEIAISGEFLVPLSTSESIGSSVSAIELEPGTRTGFRSRLRAVFMARYVAELEMRSVRFDESDPVRLDEDDPTEIYQPESSLQRISLMAGRIF